MDKTRLHDIDALRGFALLGILVVNLEFMASPYLVWDVPDPAVESTAGHLAQWLVLVCCESKFYPLFAFLFGYSFTLAITSAATTGARFTPRFLRRLLGLCLLGLAHGLLLFPGDILTLYAILGLGLLLMRHARPSRAIALAVFLVVLTGTAVITLGVLSEPSPDVGVDPALVEAAERNLDQLRGGIGSVIAAHREQLPYTWGFIGLIQGPLAMAGFLAGYAAGSRRLLEAPDRLGALLRRTQLVGFPIGLVAAIGYASAAMTVPGSSYHTIWFGITMLTSPLLSAAYAATLLRTLRTRWGTRLGRLLAPVGRMSLTSYLSQSAAGLALFTGVGLGLVGRVSPARLLGIAATLYLVQALVSWWWLRHFRYGPVEWLLRTWTVLGRIPLRKGTVPASSQTQNAR